VGSNGFAGIGVAVIGSGFIGTVHIGALRRLGVQVLGLLEDTPEHGAERADALGLPQAWPDLEALLSDPRVGVVHVTSPNQLHYPQVKQILAAGRHVVCEKPLAVTAEESAELVRLAAASDRIAAVNFNIRFYPLNQHAHQLVRDGGLGQVRLITGHYFQDWLLKDTDWNWRLDPAVGGSLRAVGDIGSHWVDLTSFVSGERVAAVMAELQTVVKVRQRPTGPVETFSTDRSAETVPVEMTTDDVALILLRYASGAVGSVSISQVSAGRKNSIAWEINGSSASAAWDGEVPDQLWIGHRDEPNGLLLRNPALMNATGAAAASLPGGHGEGFGDTFHALFREIYRAIVAGRAPEHPLYATFADGHHEMLVGDAVAQSARDGRWVEVPAG
jgi:predicted dehydrogenase